MLIKNGVDIYATNSLFVKVTNDTIADNVTDASGIVKNTTVQAVLKNLVTIVISLNQFLHKIKNNLNSNIENEKYIFYI